MTTTGFALTGHTYSMPAMSGVKAFDFFSMELSVFILFEDAIDFRLALSINCVTPEL